MKTTQVVSGFVLGASLLIPFQFLNATVVFNDGAVHIVNDASLQFEYIEVRNGSTLRLETGAVVGGPSEQSGTINVYDLSRVEIAGAQLGGSGGSSGGILLYDNSQVTIESGTLGADGPSSGQVAAFNQSSVILLGGSFGGAGSTSGMIGLFDSSSGEIHGGQFGGPGDYSGLFIGFGESQTLVFACETGLPAGPVLETTGMIAGVTRGGAPLSLEFMREVTATIALVEDCDGGGADTDGDGVPDVADLCPESDLRPTVWIFEIDTRIQNLIDGQAVNADGCSLADLVNAMVQESADNARNHGEFLRSVIIGLREFRREGLLPRRFHGHFVNCAARSKKADASDSRRHSRRDYRLR